MSAPDDGADVLAVLAHRLLGSVSAVRGAASLLARRDLPAERLEELAMLVVAEADELELFVRRLLRGDVTAEVCS